MKLEFLYCRKCNANHPPGEHLARPKKAAARPDDPPAPTNWEGTPPPTPKPPAVPRFTDKPGRGAPAKTANARVKAAMTEQELAKAHGITVPELRAKLKKSKTARKKANPKRAAPDFAAADPSSAPPAPPPKRKQTPTYHKKMLILMRQKRAAKREGLTLDAYRAKHGENYCPRALRRTARG